MTVSLVKSIASAAMVASVVATASVAEDGHAAGGIIAEFQDIDIALVTEGWSVVELLRGNVYNDIGEFIGYVHDAIVTPDGETTFVIVNVAGFLNVGQKLVAIPTKGFELRRDGNLVIPMATREALNALPEFRYAKN